MEERVGHKILAQSSKKGTKNTARLPRTAGLRTLSELTGELTAAGYDPSKIQERAEMLAKIQGAKRKREREEDEARMDEDSQSDEDEDGGFEDEDGDVEMGGGREKVVKKVKTNSGGVVNKRVPASDRQMTGLRDQGVRSVFYSCSSSCTDTHPNDVSNSRKRGNCTSSRSGRGMRWPRLERRIDRSKRSSRDICSLGRERVERPTGDDRLVRSSFVRSSVSLFFCPSVVCVLPPYDLLLGVLLWFCLGTRASSAKTA